MAFLDYPGLQHFKATENDQVAPVESTTTASQAYEIGEYFWCEGNFCKAKIPIALGDSLVQNTNYTVIKVGDEIENKANTDGYYENMTVGNAEQIVATEGVEDSTPYVFRKAGGGAAIANREADKLIGGTFVWNQIVRIGSDATRTSNGLTAVYDSTNQTITVNGKCTARADLGTIAMAPGSVIKDHIYLIVCGKGDKILTAHSGWNLSTDENNTVYKAIQIKKATNTGDINMTFECFTVDRQFDNVVFYPQVIDLTKMFGETIANYLFSMETATKGSGGAWFRNLFPNEYYAYDTGSLISVNVASHDMVGFNQWDEQWELGRIGATTGQNADTGYDIRSKNYIPALPNTTYCMHNPHTGNIFFYNSKKSFIAASGALDNNATFTTPENCSYIRFCTYGGSSLVSYNHDICINFSSYRNGEYEAYEINTYPIDSEIQLRGIPKLDDNNTLYYDGDIYDPDGTVTRNIGAIDISTINWSANGANSAGTGYIYYTTRSDMVSSSSIRCLKYTSINYINIWENMPVNTCQIVTNYVIFCSSESTASAFKDANIGNSFIYELATPTEDTADPYAANQVVSGGGTEEYVDAGVKAGSRDVSVPVGHNTVYQQDLRAKLQDAPNSPSEDGDYIMRRDGGQNSYVKGEYAEKAGNYPNMTVGNAEQLVSTIGIEDEIPYNFRTSGGAIDIGDRETDMLVGGTIAWNQLTEIADGKWTSGDNNITISVSSGIVTATVAGTAGRWSAATFNLHTSRAIIPGHKFLISAYMMGDHTGFDVAMQNFTPRAAVTNTVGNWTEITKIGVVEEGAYHGFQLQFGPNYASFAVGDKIQGKNTLACDLTQMFGTAIADFIYSIESTTPGAGVAWFKKLFPKPYYAYNAGTLMSVNADSHIMTGFNQWDEQWEKGSLDSNGENIQSNNQIRSKNYIPVLPSTVYCACQNGYGSRDIVVYFYDGLHNMIPYTGAGAYQNGWNSVYLTFTTPNNTRYLRFRTATTYGGTYKNDICINLSWDGERDGEYEPYIEYPYMLDNTLELRGVPKLDASNNLYYDGDTYESDGTVTRKYGVYTFNGTEPWSAYTAWGSSSTYGTPIQIEPITGTDRIFDCVVAKYVSISQNDCLNGLAIGVWMRSDNSSIYVCDPSITSPDSARAKFPQGTVLVYKMTTSTEESADPYQNPQIVDDFGTEEYVDFGVSQGTRDVSIPVGHETTYSPNLRAKLETAPDSPPSDGDYIVRQTNGQNEYVQLVIPQELPNAPTTNGTYKLQLVVSGGTGTLSWVSAT